VENIMSSKLFRTRQGTILLGVVAAVLAAIALIVYLNHYKSTVSSGGGDVQVMVAKSTIPQSTSGQVITASGLFTVKTVAKSDALAGAYSDPSELSGLATSQSIAKGQQLTSADFTAGQTGIIQNIPPKQRAVVVPLDSPGQVGDQIVPGNSVDVYALITPPSGSPVVKEILQNMYVLNTTSDGNVTLRATPKQAGQLIYASGNDKIWLTLRPPRGLGKKSPTITANSLGG
jgi:Flp pilus assembly protein CpaB